MIEVTILNYLSDVFGDEVSVLMEIPEVPSEDFPEFPEKLVVIELVGKSRSNHVCIASVAFQSYGSSLYEAAALDEYVRSAVDAMPELDEIGSAKLSSNYNFTDSRTKQYRYQCVYDIYYIE